MAFIKCSGGGNKKLTSVKPQTATQSFSAGSSKTFTISEFSKIAVIYTQPKWGQDHASLYYSEDGSSLTALVELSYFKITSFSGVTYTYKNGSDACTLAANQHIVIGYV